MEQADEWCDILLKDGYTEDDVALWKSEQKIWTQDQIDSWYISNLSQSEAQQNQFWISNNQ